MWTPVWKTCCDQIQSDMSKVAEHGGKRSEKKNQIGKCQKRVYNGQKKKKSHTHTQKKPREESQEMWDMAALWKEKKIKCSVHPSGEY